MANESKKDFKFYCKVVCIPVTLIIITLGILIYSCLVTNPFPKIFTNLRNIIEICVIELVILVTFVIYQIVDYSKANFENEEENNNKS